MPLNIEFSIEDYSAPIKPRRRAFPGILHQISCLESALRTRFKLKHPVKKAVHLMRGRHHALQFADQPFANRPHQDTFRTAVPIRRETMNGTDVEHCDAAAH